MPRETLHNETQKVICPRCKGERVEPTGPVQCIKWLDYSPARCRDCKRQWLSQNKVLLSRARQRFGEAA